MVRWWEAEGIRAPKEREGKPLMYDNRLHYRTASLSPVEIAANTSAEQTFTVTDILASDILVGVNKPTAQAGLAIVNQRISAADTVAITFGNFTGSGITPTAAQTYLFVIMRRQP